MSQHRIVVHQWVVAKTVRTYGVSLPEADLLGVALDYAVPADTEFPRERRSVSVYLRFHAREAGVTEFVVQAHRERSAGEWLLTTTFSDPGRPFVLPEDQTVDVTDVIRLPYIVLDGPGVYAVTIYFRPVSSDGEYVDGDPTEWEPDEPGWAFGAVDYFRVLKP